MANIVLLTASGIGSRTHQSIPKQFISVKEKPLIVYTMENFQKHEDIDAIVVVCLRGWESCLEAYAQQYQITKLKTITFGGETGYESIRNGLRAISEFADDDDTVLIHDGNRPLTEAKIISECIKTIKEKGNAVTVIPVVEVVFDLSEEREKLLNRDNLVRVQTPMGARLNYLLKTYKRAEDEKIKNAVGFCSLMHIFNEKINFVYGNEKNFKITYKEDIDMFRGLMSLNQ